MFQIRTLREIALDEDVNHLLSEKRVYNINRFTNSYIVPLSYLSLTSFDLKVKPISYLIQQMKAKKKEYEKEGIHSDSICEINVHGGFVFKKEYNLFIKKNCRNIRNELYFLDTHFITKKERELKAMKTTKQRKIIYRNRSHKKLL